LLELRGLRLERNQVNSGVPIAHSDRYQSLFSIGHC
jgi:hypothetical protein